MNTSRISFLWSVLIILSCLTLVFNPVFAQKGAFLSGGLEFGRVGHLYQFEQNGRVLQKLWKGPDGHRPPGMVVNPDIRLNYISFGRLGFSFGLKWMEKDIAVHDQKLFDRLGFKGSTYYGNVNGVEADSGNFNTAKWYFSPNVSIDYYFKDGIHTHSPYISCGVDYNLYLSKRHQVPVSAYLPEHDIGMDLLVEYKRRFPSMHVEIGYLFLGAGPKKTQGQNIQSKGTIVKLALRYTFSKTFVSGSYQTFLHGLPQYSDKFSGLANYLALSVKVGGNLFANRVTQVKSPKPEKVKKQKTEPVPAQVDRDSLLPKSLRDRKVLVKKVIQVHSSHIRITYWDHSQFDADIISLNLNSRWIIENDTITLEKKTLHDTLHRGSNYLLMHAVSEGEIRPCTASIEIDDGISKQAFVLDADLKSTAAIRIELE